MKVLAVIPARYASTRLPGKPLLKIGGKPMLDHVVDRVRETELFADVIVATDDDRIMQHCEARDVHCMKTSPDHPNGTSRCSEVMMQLLNKDKEYELVVNIQGDEPFISAEPLESLIRLFTEKENVGVATLVRHETDPEELTNPHSVRVVRGVDDLALYFSRATLPFSRATGGAPDPQVKYYSHVGIYAYTSRMLSTLANLPPCELENVEMLEQLRWIYYGIKIHTAETAYQLIGVDTPEDLAKANNYFQNLNSTLS